jgi:hypothetical protein
MHSFAGMVHNENTTRNNDKISHSLDVMSIYLDLIGEPSGAMMAKLGTKTDRLITDTQMVAPFRLSYLIHSII